MFFRPLQTILIVIFLNQSVAVSGILYQLNSINTIKQNALDHSDSQSKIKTQSLRVLVRESAPFTFKISDGRYGGIEIQFVEALAKEMNVAINYVSYNGSSSQPNDIEG